MAFESFKTKVIALIKRANLPSDCVRFSSEDGRHFARFFDGTTITGNSVTSKIEVTWGSGHKAIAEI